MLRFSAFPKQRRTARATGKARAERSAESGYALLMALVMIMALTVGAQVALQNMKTQGRREREEEMIWRGNQWVRAIRIYYHKKGRYPQTAKDLKEGLPGVHFLRLAAYNDPTNADTSDDSWRFIYTNAGGQLIGSVRYANLQQMALMDQNGGKLPAVQAGALPGVSASSMASSSIGLSTANDPTNSSGAANATSSPTTGANQTANPLAQLKPTGPVDGPVLGGFLTGVAGRANRDSVKVYHGGKKYKDWEFIWNPLEDQAAALQQGLGNPGQATNPGQAPAQTAKPADGSAAPPAATPPDSATPPTQ
jgi:hypothetical protein